jgi:hypothetical protein
MSQGLVHIFSVPAVFLDQVVLVVLFGGNKGHSEFFGIEVGNKPVCRNTYFALVLVKQVPRVQHTRIIATYNINKN